MSVGLVETTQSVGYIPMAHAASQTGLLKYYCGLKSDSSLAINVRCPDVFILAHTAIAIASYAGKLVLMAST